MLIAEADVVHDVVDDVVDDVVGAGYATLEELLAFEPTASLVMFLEQIDPAELDEAGRVLLMQLWVRQQNWLAEKVISATAAVCGPSPEPDGDDWSVDLVAAALGLPTGGARATVGTARALTERLPLCRAAMSDGHLSDYQARVIADAVKELDPVGVASVDQRVAQRIPGQSWSAFRRTLRVALHRAAPKTAAEAHERAVRDREVERSYLDSGMGSITATMSAVDTQTVWQGLDVAARRLQIQAKQAGDVDAGIDAYRADALVVWATAALTAPDAPTQQGRRPQIQFVVDLPTLLGLANNPAELVGYGPVAASVVQALAADADWRRLVVEPVTGHLLDYGSRVYRPPQELKDFVVARDRHCRFPGCNRRATYCDIEHCVPFPVGATASHNCYSLCRRHHRLKTHGGWQVELFRDASCRWTALNGRTFDVGPPTQLD
jgi:hypothetical protein